MQPEPRRIQAEALRILAAVRWRWAGLPSKMEARCRELPAGRSPGQRSRGWHRNDCKMRIVDLLRCGIEDTAWHRLLHADRGSCLKRGPVVRLQMSPEYSNRGQRLDK